MRTTTQGDDWTPEEIRRAAWSALLGVSVDVIARDLGRHTPDSVYLMLSTIGGTPGMHASRVMVETAEQLDGDPRFGDGWRDELLSVLRRPRGR